MTTLVKSKILIIIAIIVILLGVTYSIILHDTDAVIDDFYNCINNRVTSNIIENTELYRYYNKSDLYSEGVSETDIKAKRLFVMHNFHKGVMFIKYDCKIFNKHGDLIYGSSNIYAKWYIEKNDGIWVVTDVIEKP